MDIVGKFKRKGGSYIAEAAVVLPIIILVTLTLVLTIMFYYSSSVSQSQMHMALRYEAGKYTEHIGRVDFKNDYKYEIQIERCKGGHWAISENRIYMLEKGVLRRKLSKPIGGYWHCNDGPKYIRRFNLK